MKFIIDFLPAFGLVGLLFVFVKNNWIAKQEVGTDKMARIADNIAKGAMSFLKAEYKILSILGSALGTADAVLGGQLIHVAGHLALQKFAAVWPAQLNISSWIYGFFHCPPAIKFKIACEF